MRTPSQPIIHLMTAVMQVILKLFSYFLWFSPIGIASLICNALLRVESDISVTFELLGYFAMTIVVGLVFHQLVYLQVMYVLIVRSNPVVMFINSLKSWITIFATTSSYAVMPEMIRTCEKHGVDRRVYGFVVPFCAGTNRNGSAIFVTAATIFIAQMNGISLNPATTFTIGLLVSLAMFALPGVPSASMVCILMILTSTGLPTNSINMLFALEWILDRLRSTSNVLSTCYCAAIVNKLVTDDIERWDALQLHEGNEQTVVFLKESAV
ncbi:excitatory amino acid transporter 2-like [Tubulanus polymorphus]|uniref:excitatory amino acid transporter 2-like n=1 Tax=Tubulanus polymorphus TaxID=672921 RepID=UPI003DA61BBB